jgi:hypothetical protein
VKPRGRPQAPDICASLRHRLAPRTTISHPGRPYKPAPTRRRQHCAGENPSRRARRPTLKPKPSHTSRSDALREAPATDPMAGILAKCDRNTGPDPLFFIRRPLRACQVTSSRRSVARERGTELSFGRRLGRASHRGCGTRSSDPRLRWCPVSARRARRSRAETARPLTRLNTLKRSPAKSLNAKRSVLGSAWLESLSRIVLPGRARSLADTHPPMPACPLPVIKTQAYDDRHLARAREQAAWLWRRRRRRCRRGAVPVVCPFARATSSF